MHQDRNAGESSSSMRKHQNGKPHPESLAAGGNHALKEAIERSPSDLLKELRFVWDLPEDKPIRVIGRVWLKALADGRELWFLDDIEHPEPIFFGIVLFMAPLGMIGVVGALLFSGQPLGFVAILGVLALVGMIAKNAVILLEQIEDDLRSGKPMRAAITDASASRVRPIALTALSTVLGLIPIAFTVFWGAMAFAIMGGLAVASVLTLLVLPVLYDLVFNRGSQLE